MKYIRQEKKDPNGKYDTGAARVSGNKKMSIKMVLNLKSIFQYTPSTKLSNRIFGGRGKAIKIAKDAVTYCTSGLVDRNKNTVLSYLHKAIKALNQLRMIEDSLVIYRFPEHQNVVFSILTLVIFQK